MLKNDNIEEIPKPKKTRLISIDLLKGIAVIVMIGGHTMNFWTAPGGEWMYAMMYLYYCSILTSVCFVMMAGVTVPISYLSKVDSGWSKKRTMIHILKRTGVLLVISVIYNILIGSIIGSFVWNSFFGYYSWFVLQLIAFSIILTVLLMPYNKYFRLILGITFILISTPVYYFLTSFGNPVSDLISNLIFNPYQDFPFLPWSGVILIGSVIGEVMYGINKSPDDIKKRKMRVLMRNMIIIGLVLLLFGFISGLGYPPITDWYWNWYAKTFASDLSTNPYLFYPSLPYFMLVGHWTYLFYAIGGLLIIFAFIFFLVDYRNYKNKLFNSFAFTGKMAFSIFIYHHIGIPFLVDTIPVFWIWQVIIPYAILIPFLVWLNVKYLKGIGTIEWLMVMATSISFKKIKKD
jgi:uncharacterized membrane protein